MLDLFRLRNFKVVVIYKNLNLKKAYIINELAVNEYKYKTLFATMSFDYVPLNNATLKEVVTVTNDLEDVTGGKTDTITETVETDDKSTTNTVTVKNSSFG